MASTIDNFACADGLEPEQARQKIRSILQEGIVSFSMQALAQMGAEEAGSAGDDGGPTVVGHGLYSTVATGSGTLGRPRET